jgi:hypothetical protein
LIEKRVIGMVSASGERTLAQASAYDPNVLHGGRYPAFVTGAVHRGELPILLVLHEEDGAWQFLDGGAVSEDDALMLHVEHVFDEHPELRHLVDLPEGWVAERESVTGGWRRDPWQPE